jgi:bidirectional [NiFe] hydrogenase diaphorase subunit
MPTITIDGRTVQAREGAFLLEEVRRAGIAIPTLCHHEALESWGGCRLCLVDITRQGWDGWCKMVVSCLYPVEQGLIVLTDTERVRATRRVVVDLLLARCPETPLVRKMAREHGIERTSYRASSEPTDCVLCGLCTRVCDRIGVSAIASANRGAGREIAPPFNQPPPACIGCLSCAQLCPTGHIRYETSARHRTIWGRTFEMLQCSLCGRSHITREQAAFYAGRNGVPSGYFETCDACKRRQHAELFARLGSGQQVAP